MKITIKGTNIKLSDSIYNYINKKINELEKFVENVGEEGTGKQNPSVEAWVEVGRTTKHHRTGDVYRAEVQVRLPGAEGIRADSTQWDLHQAIDEAKDEMQRQLKRYKRKQSARGKRSSRKMKDKTRFSELV